jgi:hypothetical protein
VRLENGVIAGGDSRAPDPFSALTRCLLHSSVMFHSFRVDGQNLASGLSYPPAQYCLDSQLVSVSASFLSVDVTSVYTGGILNAVPDPSTWAMMPVRLFGVGFVVRRARHKDAVAVT